MSPKRTAACVSPDRPSKSKHNSLTNHPIRCNGCQNMSPKKKQEPHHRTSKPSTPSALPQQKPPVCVRGVPIFRIVDRWMAGWNLGLFFFSFFFGVRPSITCTPPHIIILKKGLHQPHHHHPRHPYLPKLPKTTTRHTTTICPSMYLPTTLVIGIHPSIHASIHPCIHPANAA